MLVHINSTNLVSSRIEQLLKLKKYNSIKIEDYDVNIQTGKGEYLFELNEKETIHRDFIVALLESRIPMNITY